MLRFAAAKWMSETRCVFKARTAYRCSMLLLHPVVVHPCISSRAPFALRLGGGGVRSVDRCLERRLDRRLGRTWEAMDTECCIMGYCRPGWVCFVPSLQTLDLTPKQRYLRLSSSSSTALYTPYPLELKAASEPHRTQPFRLLTILTRMYKRHPPHESPITPCAQLIKKPGLVAVIHCR